ncbi:hypothetical protein NliqN6_2111 [Naganishia liquefaciens]|uniref:HD/PDEase domain-containing protein n=1 Tax=Naganishia liquefaciens TaxID=104408 RepID=A0A8H3TRM1_9TREE|nr:hypothetical protein NliqN6_2111 [Naganishia liquefaciens]
MSILHSSTETEALVRHAEELVKEHMSKYDPSHDWYHVDRVRRTALKLAKSLQDDTEARNEGFVPPDMLLVELVALFHDMADAKYAETSSLETVLAPFLTSSLTESMLSKEQMSLLLSIIPRISWSTEKKLRTAGTWDDLVADMQRNGGWVELAVVQDADRLDAIGAFGIMRCAAYSSATNRPLCVPAISSETISRGSENEAHRALVDSSAIQHFHDKLLHIRNRMKTPLGKQEATRRHDFMLQFLEEVDHESAA